MGNPQALCWQIDFFSRQDLNAFTTSVHAYVKETVKELLEELKQEPMLSQIVFKSPHPGSRGSGTGKRFLIGIQAKNNTNVFVWTKRSRIVPL